MQPTNNHHITDKELLNLYYSYHDNKWIGILLQRYTLLLFGICMKYLKNEEAAKDAVQQIFLKAITEIKKYEIEYFKSWIYVLARNYCLMQLRNKYIFTELNDTHLEEAEEKLDFNILQAKEQSYDKLEKAIIQLKTEQKTCISLFYLQNKSYLQIAQSTGFSILQVKSFIQNGKRNLKLIMQKSDKEYQNNERR